MARGDEALPHCRPPRGAPQVSIPAAWRRTLALLLLALVHGSWLIGETEAVVGVRAKAATARGSLLTRAARAKTSAASALRLRRTSAVGSRARRLPSRVGLASAAAAAAGAAKASAARATAARLATVRAASASSAKVQASTVDLDSERDDADADQTSVPQGSEDEEEEVPTASKGRKHTNPPTDEECRRLRMGQNSTGAGTSRGEKGAYQRVPGQCWSRNEWRCFAHRGANAPSPALMRRIRRYRRHWRWCNSEETPYRALTLLGSGKPTVCKYIMVSPMEMGIGNHVLSVLSAFTYALLTSRILFLEPSDNPIPDLFCEPFAGTPSWSLQHKHILGGPEKKAAPPLTYSYRVNENVNLSKPAPVALQFHTHHRVHMQRYFCERFHRWAENSSALLSSSNMWWVPSLMFVPHMRTRLQRLFPNNRVFATLAPLILHPNNRVWRAVTALLEAQQVDAMAPSRPMVGIQYRNHGGLPMEQGLDSIGYCISHLFPSLTQSFSSPQPKSVSVYLASLDPEFRSSFTRHMRKFRVHANLTSLTADVGQKSEDLEHNERALTELLSISLLSKTIIISPRSTFGYLMVGFSSAEPWFFSKTCRRASREPCFLIPPAFVNCTLKGDTFANEADHPDVHGSNNYRHGPLPTQYTGVPLGEGARIEGMELHGPQGVLVSECPDSSWVRTQGGEKLCPYGIRVNAKDQPQGSS